MPFCAVDYLAKNSLLCGARRWGHCREIRVRVSGWRQRCVKPFQVFHPASMWVREQILAHDVCRVMSLNFSLRSSGASSSRCSQYKSGDVARCPASIGICGKNTGSNGARICTLWVSYRQTQTQTQTRRNTLSLRASTFSARLAFSNRSPSASSCARALDKNNVYELKSVVPSDRGIPSRPLTYHCSIIVYTYVTFHPFSPSVCFACTSPCLPPQLFHDPYFTPCVTVSSSAYTAPP
ncbi:hypothetical protein DFH06DRAFT_170954 [Mycena polygramma]|nr:hypothetical protein DFH06DRAFT_170954 [Mycena polygramma]